MSDELIKRIDDVDYGAISGKLEVLLTDCRTEITRLLAANETIKALNVEYAERIKLLETKILAGEGFHVLDLYKSGDGNYMENGLQVTFKDGRLVAVKDFSKPSIDALIAEAIEKHDAKNLLIKSVNMRTQAQPYLDELIAEIDGLERIDFDEGGCDYPCSDGDNYRFDDVRAVLNKYRSKP